MIASAVIFIVLLFFIKNKSLFTNIVNYTNQQSSQEGLTYNKEIIGNLVNRDIDKDGVLDWEEGLWGTDPTKKDTNDDGVPDNVEIEKLKQQTEQNQQGGPLLDLLENSENLTETDKFSRELFATVATLNQTGQMDQATIDKLSDSLAEHIQNTPPKKVFVISDIKIIKDDPSSTSGQAIKNYNDTIDNIYQKYPIKKGVIAILQEFSADENDVDISILSELDPVIEQMTQILDAIVKTNVPQTLSALHLDLTNGFQRLLENISDIKLYDTDAIVALSAISQYEKNAATLETTLNDLGSAIEQKLNN